MDCHCDWIFGASVYELNMLSLSPTKHIQQSPNAACCSVYMSFLATVYFECVRCDKLNWLIWGRESSETKLQLASG